MSVLLVASCCFAEPPAGTIVIRIEKIEFKPRWLINNRPVELDALQAMLAKWSKEGDQSKVMLTPQSDIDFSTWLLTREVVEKAGYLDIRSTISVPGEKGPQEQEIILQPVIKSSAKSSPVPN